MQRTDFKQRLVTLSGRALLESRELVSAVARCLDLSSIAPGAKFQILPGRPHPTDHFDENRARRQLTSVLYKEQQEVGVHLNPLTYEEARYVNEVTGAMLIWIHRIFAQHNLLISEWKKASLAVNVAWQAVLAARKKAHFRRHQMEELEAERDALREHERDAMEIPKAVELVRPPPAHDPKQVLLDRASPNIFFQNGRIAGRSTARGQSLMWELPVHHRLPPVIRFFVRLKSYRATFPLPPSYPASQYLHEAKVMEGQESLGPVAHIPFDTAHVVGLVDHNLLTFTQLVIEVPSSSTINSSLRATHLSFHPRHESQLHDYTSRLPRIIVPVFSFGSRGNVRGDRATSAPVRERPEATEAISDVADAAFVVPTWRAPHKAPSFVPQLAIPRQHADATIGSPFNAGELLKVLDSDGQLLMEAGLMGAMQRGAGDGWRSPSPSSRGAGGRALPGTPKSGAWSNASLASPQAAEAVLTFRQQRSPSPGARAAAARIAAFKAELLIEPLIQRVVAGYMLLQPEMVRLRRYTDILDAREKTGALTRGGAPTTHLRDIERASRASPYRKAHVVASPDIRRAGMSPRPNPATTPASPSLLPTDDVVRKGGPRNGPLGESILSPQRIAAIAAMTRGVE